MGHVRHHKLGVIVHNGKGLTRTFLISPKMAFNEQFVRGACGFRIVGRLLGLGSSHNAKNECLLFNQKDKQPISIVKPT